MKKILSLTLAMMLFAGMSFAQSAKVSTDKVTASEEGVAAQSNVVYKVNGDSPSDLLQGKQAQAEANAKGEKSAKECDGKAKKDGKACCAKDGAKAQAKATSSGGASAKSCDKKGKSGKACCAHGKASSAESSIKSDDKADN